MLKKEANQEILILHRRGMGIRAISRELNIARNVVRECVAYVHRRLPVAGTGRPRKRKGSLVVFLEARQELWPSLDRNSG